MMTMWHQNVCPLSTRLINLKRNDGVDSEQDENGKGTNLYKVVGALLDALSAATAY